MSVKSILSGTLLAIVAFSPECFALPWDIDMYRQQSLKANEVARSPVTGTVAVGAKPFLLSNDDAEKQLKNPVAPTEDSVRRGKRIFSANCQTCHGEKGDGKGPVGPLMAAPDILTEYYTNQRGDGRIYGVLMNGGSNMPRYGYKFSESERWDVVNYVRFLQGKVTIDGMKRP